MPSFSAPRPSVTGPRPVATSSRSNDSFCDFLIGALHFDVDALGAGLRGRDLRAGHHLDAALLERALELGRHRLVFARHQARQQLDHRDLAAVALEDRRELDADGAAAHDGDRLRHRRQVNRFVAEDDLLAIDLDARHAARRRAGGDDDLFRRRERLLAAVVPSVDRRRASLDAPPVRRAVPLIQSILFFLNSISMPPVRPEIILSLRACTAGMSIETAAPSMPVSPHSFADCATLSACACSSKALVGIQPQIRQVPPSAFCFSTTATLRPSCAARMAATYPPVPAPITMTSYSLATIFHCNPT